MDKIDIEWPVLTAVTFWGLPPCERAGDPSLQNSNTSLAALNCWYATQTDSLPFTFTHVASCIHRCRRDRSRGSVDCMYPSKGRSDSRILFLAFDTHDAASAREKRQVIYVTHPGLASLRTFVLIRAFTKQMWGCPTFGLVEAMQLRSSWIWGVGANTLVKCHVLHLPR